MSLRCNITGHQFKYNFSTMPNKRICIVCKKRQHLCWDDLVWKDGFKHPDLRTDQELISKWVDVKYGIGGPLL